MKKVIKLSALALLLVTQLCAAQTETVADQLRRFNQVSIPDNERIIEAVDDGAIAAFGNYKFTCRKQEDFSPEESAKAKKSLKNLLSFAARHPAPSQAQVKETEDLMAKAIKAGSWRAKYIDLSLRIWKGLHWEQAAIPQLSEELADMTAEGIPAAAYGYVQWMGGLHDDKAERYRLLEAAIDRGNPQAMVLIGDLIGMHSMVLRPMGKEMLDCAASQGEPSAYGSMGKIAWREGRWVDAYRLWEKGLNAGCGSCFDAMRGLSRLKSRLGAGNETFDPRLQLDALRKFYSGQFLIQNSGMGELLEKAPQYMEFHVTDEQIVELIRSRQAR